MVEQAVVRPVSADDAPGMASIYNHYVANTTITFEEQPVTAEEMAVRREEVRSAALPWLVLERDAEICGYASASKWKSRSAYRFAVEITVYVDTRSVGQGMGSALYQALFAALVERGVHAVIGGIALPNDASIALHEKFGLKKVAHFQEVGFKFNRRIDVGYWEKVLA